MYTHDRCPDRIPQDKIPQEKMPLGKMLQKNVTWIRKNGVTKFKVIIKVKVMVDVRFMSHFFPGHFSCKQSIPGVLPLVGLMDPPVVCTSYTLNKSQLDIQDELNLIVSLDIQNCANLLYNANPNLLVTQR